MIKMDNPLEAFSAWAASVQENWCDLALTRAQNAVIDTLAVIIPGAQEEVSKTVASLAVKWGKGTCHAIGFKEGLSAPMAALVNGTSAHALDYDDNFDPAKAHASAVLVPALLAMGEEANASYDQLIDAYIVGLQIMGLVGQGVNPFHRSRGWHATATVGTVGAAAGCARLLNLNQEKTAHAISLSTSLAGGFMSQFGTMTKPLHAGLAAAGAVQAAQFAEAGITAGSEALHGSQGMGTLMVGPDVEDLRALMADKDEHGQKTVFRTNDIGTPLHIEKYGLKVKRFPNCGSIHRSLDGLLELRAKHGFTHKDVKQILVRAPASHLNNLMYEKPDTPAEARFSLEYSMAVGLYNGKVGITDYTEDAIKHTAIRGLMPLIRKDYIEKLETEFPTEVHITLHSGETVMTAIEMPIGSSSNPLSNDQLWAKFETCTTGIFGPEKIKALQKATKTDYKNTKICTLTQLLTH